MSAARPSAVRPSVPEEPRLFFTNSSHFDELEDSETFLLFYNGGSFDSERDERLFRLFAASPYEFDNTTQLSEYEELVDRDAFELRLHPDQPAARDFAAADLTAASAGDITVFVYRRTTGSRFDTSPFENLDAPVLLFRQYSFEPANRGTFVWQWSKRVGNSSVGLIGVRLDEKLG